MSNLLKYDRPPPLIWLGGVANGMCKGNGDVVKALRFSESDGVIGTNGFLLARAINNNYEITCTNTTASKCSFGVNAVFFNSYGAEIYSAVDEREVMPKEGGRLLITCPNHLKKCQCPDYTVLRCVRK